MTQLSFFIGENKTKPSRRNSEKPKPNQPKEFLCIYVSFQESWDSIKEEPETNVFDLFLSSWRWYLSFNVK